MEYSKLKAVVESKGFTFFNLGNYNLNLIFERTSDIFTDFFTDNLYVAYKVNGVKTVLQVPCSTKAGLYYVNNPITYQGVTGTAVIVAPAQYRRVYTLVDSYTEWLSYPYFKQVKNMSYWRDADRDKDLDKTQFQVNQNFSTHFHRGSNKNVTGQQIYNFSAGCIICEEPYFKKVLSLARESVKIWGNSFSITILESKDLF